MDDEYDGGQTYHPTSGHKGPGVFWEKGRVKIYRHCDGVFELFCDANSVMPPTSFERVLEYVRLEFEVLDEFQAKRLEDKA